MSSTHESRPGRHSIAIRLTLFHALFFGLVTTAGGILLYHLVEVYIVDEVDQDILRQKNDIVRTFQTDGPASARTQVAADARNGDKEDYFVRVSDRSGRILSASDLTGWPAAGTLDALSRDLGPGEQRFDTLDLADARRAARVVTAALATDRFLQVGISMGDSVALLEHVRRYGLIILATMLSLGAAASWGLAHRAMAGVQAVTQAAEHIAGGHYAERVVSAGQGQEIDDLVRTFNRMADRVQTVMQEMRQVNDHIAHDLRSPLTRIRGLAEAAVTDPTIGEEAAELAGGVVEECDHLIGIINTMLDIAETEAGVQHLQVEPVDLSALAAQAVDLFSGVADDKGVDLDYRADSPPLLRGDRRRLQRALANLVDNAIKYTPAGGRVELSVGTDAGSARIAVRDTGSGIAPEAVPHLFERFYRGDESRQLPGNGLGLSLALAVAHAHGGDILVESKLHAGSRFTLVLPLEPELARA